MYQEFNLIYIANENASSSIIREAFNKAKVLVEEKKHAKNIKKSELSPEKMDQLKSFVPAIVIFDQLRPGQISKALLDEIKLISPLTHFVYYCEKYDESLFLKMLEKEIEFCVSLDTFSQKLFFETIKNIFFKIYRLWKFNRVIIQGNNVSINLIERMCWVDGKEVKLTSNEFDCLRLIMEHPNTDFSKNQIFQRIWGHNDDVTGVVNQYFYKLKKKIGKDNIITSAKKGYRFDLKELTF